MQEVEKGGLYGGSFCICGLGGGSHPSKPLAPLQAPFKPSSSSLQAPFKPPSSLEALEAPFKGFEAPLKPLAKPLQAPKGTWGKGLQNQPHWTCEEDPFSNLAVYFWTLLNCQVPTNKYRKIQKRILLTGSFWSLHSNLSKQGRNTGHVTNSGHMFQKYKHLWPWTVFRSFALKLLIPLRSFLPLLGRLLECFGKDRWQFFLFVLCCFLAGLFGLGFFWVAWFCWLFFWGFAWMKIVIFLLLCTVLLFRSLASDCCRRGLHVPRPLLHEEKKKLPKKTMLLGTPTNPWHGGLWLCYVTALVHLADATQELCDTMHHGLPVLSGSDGRVSSWFPCLWLASGL